MEMNPKQREWWSKTRRQGRKSYIWKHGVLYWGVPVGIVWALWMNRQQDPWQLAVMLPLALVVFPIGGYFFGAFMWKHFESAYEKPPA